MVGFPVNGLISITSLNSPYCCSPASQSCCIVSTPPFLDANGCNSHLASLVGSFSNRLNIRACINIPPLASMKQPSPSATLPSKSFAIEPLPYRRSALSTSQILFGVPDDLSHCCSRIPKYRTKRSAKSIIPISFQPQPAGLFGEPFGPLAETSRSIS